MISPDLLTILFTRTHDIVVHRVSQLTHDDSLITFPPPGNCLNWTMGHITLTRWNQVTTLGSRASIWDFAEAKRYIADTPPITDPAEAVALDRLLAIYDRAHDETIRLLETINGDALEAPVVSGALVGRTLGEELVYSQTHEAYHVGQLELYCQLLGQGGVIDYR
jgi:hypothetical protein